MIITILGNSAVATLAKSELGIPVWFTLCLFGTIPIGAATLVVICLFGTRNSPLHKAAYGLLKASCGGCQASTRRYAPRHCSKLTQLCVGKREVPRTTAGPAQRNQDRQA